MRNDVRCGFSAVKARDLDKIGTAGVISQIKERVGDSKVYISVDIDVLDPAFAPGKRPVTYLERRGMPILTINASDGNARTGRLVVEGASHDSRRAKRLRHRRRRRRGGIADLRHGGSDNGACGR